MDNYKEGSDIDLAVKGKYIDSNTITKLTNLLNKEQGTKNPEHRTQNTEQGTKNKEQRTRNKEQGTKNKEQ